MFLGYVKHCFVCLDIILSFSGALLCCRKKVRRNFLDSRYVVDMLSKVRFRDVYMNISDAPDPMLTFLRPENMKHVKFSTFKVSTFRLFFKKHSSRQKVHV